MDSNLLGRTIRGMIHSMRTLIRQTTQLNFLENSVCELINNEPRCMIFFNHIHAGLTASLRDHLQSKSLTEHHIRSAQRVTRSTGSGIYAIFYEMPSGEDHCLYIGRSVEMNRRLEQHDRAL